jgi:probable HAF family extracellular repeat protein
LLESLEERCLLSYQITDLGALPGDTGSEAFGINDSGQVVGESFPRIDGNSFLWDATNGMQDLGTLPGDRFSRAQGVNNSGQVVGFSGTAADHTHAFLWDAVHGMQDLGTLPGDSFSKALGVNDSGQVVGYSCTSFSGPCHAFLWDATNGMQNLGTLPGDTSSFAFGINNSGQVVGNSFNPLNGQHAFLWDATNGMQNLGTLPGDSRSIARGINDSGKVVGQSEGRITHAFLWDAVNGMQALPTLDRGAFATGINSNGQMVGAAEVYDPVVNDYFYEPSVWQNGTVSDLNQVIPPSSGWVLVDAANALNNDGQIVGFGDHNGQSRAYLLTPDSSALTPGGSVHFTRSDAPAALLAGSTVTAVDASVHPFSLTLATLPGQTLAVTDPAEATRIGSATVPLTSDATAPAGRTVPNATDALFASSLRANASVFASDWEVKDLELGVSLLPKL